MCAIIGVCVGAFGGDSVRPYTVVDTGQTTSYDNRGPITAPKPGEVYYGQDAQYAGPSPSYVNNGDGTITDLNTGLTWVQARGSKVTWDAAVAGAATNRTGGYSDWRMPTIKELYSLILYTGVNGPSVTDTTGYVPFIDTNYFGFTYGPGTSDTVGQRVIDCQDWSATEYVSTVMNGVAAVFGVNFADGRIKGYSKYTGNGAANTLYVRYVRGNPAYGKNQFVDNQDATITDLATGLMWPGADSGKGMDWPSALARVQTQNAAKYLGYSDWRLPNIKELQSIVDYTRSPATTASPAIDTRYFTSTGITNEAGQADYPYVWSGTILIDGPIPSGNYISFGRAMGYMNGTWMDVHGAGSMKSDILVGNPANYPNGRGPQGDAIRIYNYVRLVRTANGQSSSGPVLPSINPGGVVTAGTFGAFPSIAPGAWIEIYGSNLGTGSRAWTGADFNGIHAPTSLDGTTVTIGGQPAFIAYVSPSQVNAQAPSNLATGQQSITVTTVSGTSASSTITVKAIAAGMWAPSFTNIGGKQYVAALFPDWTFVLPAGAIPGVASRPAKPGETIIIFGNGFGPVIPDIPAGQLVQQNNQLATAPFQIFFGGTPAAAPAYWGLSPSLVGVYQFNVVVPNVAASDAVPLTFTLGGVSGTQTLYTAVGN